MTPLTFLTLFVGAVIFLLCCAYVVAEMKYQKFNNDCIFLEAFIRNSKCDDLYRYAKANRLWHDLKCSSDRDLRRKKSIWVSIELKFRAVSVNPLTEDQLLKICAS